MPAKELLIVAGPNGSGKSTFVAAYLAERDCPYLCADAIAAQLDITDEFVRQYTAGQKFYTQAAELLAAGNDFIVETTLSGRTWRKYMQQAHELSFAVTVYFVYLDSADTCVNRVKQRVRRGGHNVPEGDIRRRYARSLTNFWTIYRKIADHWAIVYNAGSGLVEVAFGYHEDFLVSDEALFSRFLECVEQAGETNG
ncbi:MAG: AAA family ATPase [Pirellulales bacterium]